MSLCCTTHANTVPLVPFTVCDVSPLYNNTRQHSATPATQQHTSTQCHSCHSVFVMSLHCTTTHANTVPLVPFSVCDVSPLYNSTRQHSATRAAQQHTSTQCHSCRSVFVMSLRCTTTHTNTVPLVPFSVCDVSQLYNTRQHSATRAVQCL